MGTSTACPGSPKWGDVKRASTAAAKGGPISGEDASRIVADFVQGLCDGKDDGFGRLPSKFGTITEQTKEALKNLLAKYPAAPLQSGNVRSNAAHSSDKGNTGRSSTSGSSGGKAGTGSGGRKGSSSSTSISGRGVRPTAQRIASFLSQIPKVGLLEALRSVGLVDIANSSPEQVALALTDFLCGPNSLLVDAELRDATSALLEELCPEPRTVDQLEESFAAAAYDLDGVLARLFENYIMERFKTTLCEHLSQRFDYNTADKIALEAREFVSTEMELLRANNVDLTEVDWAGKEGGEIIDTILENTIAVYLS